MYLLHPLSPIEFSQRITKNSKEFQSIFIVLALALFFPISQPQTCATNQYAYPAASLCINCPLACETCISSMTCSTCYSSATIVTTLSTQKCYCPKGKYYDPHLIVCDACNKVILNCKQCSTGLTSSTCVTCNDGFYLYSPTSCAACPPKCKTCSSPTQCLSCFYGEYQVVNGQCVCDTKCATCLAIHPSCIDCDTRNCRKCGVGYVQKNKDCLACTTGCLKCNDKLDCSVCFAGFFLDTAIKECKSCSVEFGDPFCTECESTQCTVCVTGYRLNMATLICEPDVTITCLNTQILIDTVCIPCYVIYDPFCNTCDSFQCITCQTGYMIDTSTNACMKIPVCGDGDWVLGYENCDDRNTVDGDGCSATCQVETDYECLQADKLPTGQSFCKYTKDFVVNLLYVQKQESSNVGLFYFTFQGSTFQLWTQTQLIKFLSPIQIFDANTGTGNLLPYNNLAISFSVSNGQTLFVLTIDYGIQNIENGYIKFALDPSQTSLSQINTKPIQPAIYHLIDSRTNGVNLYSYSTDIYDMQKTIYTLSTVLGYTSFVFMLCGLITPVGKLIVVEALAVIQLGFFTVLQFDKIPPTFIGLKNLLPSNGFNDVDIVTSVEGQYQQMPYRTMGLDSNIFANYNIGFVLFFIIPFLIGLIGFIIVKLTLTRIPKYQATKESLLKDPQQKRLKDIDTNNHFTDNLRDTVFKRIIFEVSFYGLITAGYLAWISVFNSLKSPDGFSIFGFILIFVLWVVYGVLYLKIHTEQLFLPQHYVSTFYPQNTVILKGFGDFRDVYQQISKHNFYYSYAVQKVYIGFILQRIIISILIVFVSDLFAYTSIIIAVVYLGFLIVLISSHQKYQNKKVESERKPIFSYLHRNYVLRQSINFVTTIVVQLIYFIQAIKIQDTGSFVQTMTTDYLTTEMVPILILAFLYINFAINIFLWIWELKSTQIVRKALEMKKFFFSEKDFKPYSYNLEDKKKKKIPLPPLNQIQKQKVNEKQNNINTKRSVQDEELEMEKKMRSYVQKSKQLNPKKSPFLGYTQKQSQVNTPDVLSSNIDSARKLNIQMPTVTGKSKQKLFVQDGV